MLLIMHFTLFMAMYLCHMLKRKEKCIFTSGTNEASLLEAAVILSKI